MGKGRAGTTEVDPPRARIDVSMPLFEGMPSFPGDPPFLAEPFQRRARGAPYDLTALRLGSHAGTHVDPPVHFFAGGTPVDRLDLELLNGPAYVLEVAAERKAIGADDLRGIPRGTTRLLLRTGNSDRWARRLEFFPDPTTLTLEGARKLRGRGIRFVGIDALSIESGAGGGFPVHLELLGHGIPILEGLLLGEVRGGQYRIDCLPLRIRDGDGGPARAVLRPQ